MDSFSVQASKLGRPPYSYILAYPRPTAREAQRRVSELRRLGIGSVIFSGPTVLNSMPVLGKGYVGVVVLAKRRGRTVALKIRRVDSSRPEMRSEARLLKLANKVNVGPRLIDCSKNFMVMEYVEGSRIIDWAGELKGRGRAARFRAVARKVLEDCYSLDRIGLDHGELSYIHKHVIVGRPPCIIDFESASADRRTSNVTSAAQGIFIGSGLSSMVGRIMRVPDRDVMIESLKRYKHDQSRANFEGLLRVLRLDRN